MNDKKTVLVPYDVDDPNGYGARDALAITGIDRDDKPVIADMIEARWWAIYADSACTAADHAGYTVRRTDPIGSPGCNAVERSIGSDNLISLDDAVDMVAVAQEATRRFRGWWEDTATTSWSVITESLQNGTWESCGDHAYLPREETFDLIENPDQTHFGDHFGPGQYRVVAYIGGTSTTVHSATVVAK